MAGGWRFCNRYEQLGQTGATRPWDTSDKDHAMAAVETDSLQLVACPRERPTCLVTSGVLDSIGCTPLMLLKHASEATDCLIYAKAEYINPGGSIKDRIAKHIILEAELRGDLKPGATILVMLPDTGERYLSTYLFDDLQEGSDDEWLASLG